MCIVAREPPCGIPGLVSRRTTSRVDMPSMCCEDSKICSSEVVKTSPTKNGPAREYGIERRPQVDAMSSQNGACEGSPDRNRTRDSVAAAGSLADPVQESSPHRAITSPPRDAAAEADSRSAVQFRSPALSSARTLVTSSKEEKSTVTTVAATLREKSAAVTPPTASSTPSPSTADDVVKTERPSQPTAAGTNAVASSDIHSSAAAAPRGRHRVSSSPRGRPSGSPGLSSPLRPVASSSPSKRASGSPARRRGSPVASSPRVGEHSREYQVDETVMHSPSPPDLPRSCYYCMRGLSDGILGDGPRSGAFWKGGSARRGINSSNSSPHAAVNTVMSCSKAPLAKAERDTPPGASCSSCSSSSAALEQATTTTAASAAAAARKKARRVTWSPIVLAREDAAAFIRPFIKRYNEAEELRCRAAFYEAATRTFVERRAEERAERERGGVPAATTRRPVARRGAFFALLAGLYRREWIGWRMWPASCPAIVPLGLTGSQVPAAWGGGGGGGSGCAVAGNDASGTSAPPGRLTMGDVVRKAGADLLSRGQSRA